MFCLWLSIFICFLPRISIIYSWCVVLFAATLLITTCNWWSVCMYCYSMFRGRSNSLMLVLSLCCLFPWFNIPITRYKYRAILNGTALWWQIFNTGCVTSITLRPEMVNNNTVISGKILHKFQWNALNLMMKYILIAFWCNCVFTQIQSLSVALTSNSVFWDVHCVLHSGC